jgi:hypothetical protein
VLSWMTRGCPAHARATRRAIQRAWTLVTDIRYWQAGMA